MLNMLSALPERPHGGGFMSEGERTPLNPKKSSREGEKYGGKSKPNSKRKKGKGGEMRFP